MNYQVLNTTDIHFEHTTWRMELSFWEDEIKTFKNRLEEIVSKWTKKDVLAQLEHFQNQFIIHGQVIDTLQHDINVHETIMAQEDKGTSSSTGGFAESQHIKFRERMESQRDVYGDLKKKFFQFLSKYM